MNYSLRDMVLIKYGEHRALELCMVMSRHLDSMEQEPIRYKVLRLNLEDFVKSPIWSTVSESAIEGTLEDENVRRWFESALYDACVNNMKFNSFAHLIPPDWRYMYGELSHE